MRGIFVARFLWYTWIIMFGIGKFFSRSETVETPPPLEQKPEVFDELKEISSFPSEISAELMKLYNLHVQESLINKRAADFYDNKDILQHLTGRTPEQIQSDKGTFENWHDELLAITSGQVAIWDKLRILVRNLPDGEQVRYNAFLRRRTEHIKAKARAN